MHKLALGTATIQPQGAVVAGSYATITFTYTTGHPIDDSGFIKIVFRSVGDFGVPQFNDPGAPNYCSIRTHADCRIEPRWDPKGHVRPWSRALFLQIRDGFLNKGDQVTLVFGDTTAGSPGWRLQTFCEDTFEFKTLVDPIATYQFKELPQSPTLRIVPGPPVRAVCIAPSGVLTGQSFTYALKLEDRWGNPANHPIRMPHAGFTAPGLQTVTASDQETGLSAQSNPIEVLSEKPLLQPFWADFHGQSEETIGTNSVEDYFAFARDYGLLDIAAHQGNDFQVTDGFWETVNRVTRDFNVAGRFATFPGYEWSGNTPLGGDRNVFFTREGGQISRSSTELLPGQNSEFPDSPIAAALFEHLRTQNDPRAFVFAHVGGRYADLATHDEGLELAVEVHSAWGTFEWLVEDALRRGYRIGICANSDGHKGHPGASYPGASTFGSLGGLTCVLARALDRESIFDALRSRHFFATTGNRCLIDVRLATGTSQHATMGDIVNAADHTPRLYVRVVGTAPIESVEVHNGPETIKTLRPYGVGDLGNRFKITWSGAKVKGRDRMIAWDGALRVKGAQIVSVVPINFWNPDRPLKQVRANQLTWQSTTTGGVAGMILTLDKPRGASLEVETLQRHVHCALDDLELEPLQWDCGGLRANIKVCRLPDEQLIHEFSFSLDLETLHKRDNPIYIRVTQEDGHMAWTSPVYLVRAP
jgi:hypothetical protein